MRAFACLFVVLMAGLVFADEETALPQQYLQEQEFFEGHWIGEGNIGDDAARIEFRARWAPGKHALVIHGTTRRGGKNAKPVHWSLLSGCEGETMVDCSFGSDGDTSVTRWSTKSPKQQDGVETRCEDGEECTVDCRAVKDGKDKWTYTSKTSDGKSIKIEYHRVDDLEASKDDSLWQNFSKRLTGEWEGTGTLGQDLEELGLSKGDSFDYQVDWTPKVDGRVLTGEGKFKVASRDYAADVALIVCWDPTKGKIRLLAVWSGGLVEEALLSRQGGDAFFGTLSGTFPGRETVQGPIRWELPEGGPGVIKFIGGPRKGDTLSTWNRKQ